MTMGVRVVTWFVWPDEEMVVCVFLVLLFCLLMVFLPAVPGGFDKFPGHLIISPIHYVVKRSFIVGFFPRVPASLSEPNHQFAL